MLQASMNGWAIRGELVERPLVLAIRFGAPAIVVVGFLWRIFSGLDPTDRFFDDFFYYLTAARNWVEGAGSVYFPGELSNGYHPLWFLWLSLLYRLTGEGSALFFGLIDASIMVLLIGFHFLFERFLNRLTQDRLAAACGAAFATVQLMIFASYGVEMALTAFAAGLLLERLSAKPMADQDVRGAALIGLLGAFLVLSRLDAMLLAPGLAVLALMRWNVKLIAAALVGAAPVYVYFAFNIAVFGHPFTTSMSAKSLGFYFPPNFHFFDVVPYVREFYLQIAIASIAILMLLKRQAKSDLTFISLTLVCTVLLQLVMQALMSGWMMFGWYFYFGDMVLGLAVALVVTELRRRNLLGWVGAPAGVAMMGFAAVAVPVQMRPDPWHVEIAASARQLAAFAEKHPGIYAMGDAAGAPGWLVKQPIVHLEGLMMSHDFLKRIRARRPLEETFRDYGVTYYVAVRPERQDENGCLEFAEPNAVQASPRAPFMPMTICEAPVAVIEPGPRYYMRIYRIDPATGKAMAPPVVDERPHRSGPALRPRT